MSKVPILRGETDERIFAAVVMAMCGVLVDGEAITEDELEQKVIDLLEHPELMKAANIVTSIGQKIAAKQVAKWEQQQAAAKAEWANRAPAPAYNLK